MVIRTLGLVLVLAGLVTIARFRRLEAWAERVNRDLFGWQVGKPVRAYGHVVIVATGLVACALGASCIVLGASAFSG